jgi:hypothetical protein
MINEYGEVGSMKTGRGNYVLGEEISRTICTPQIPHDLTIQKKKKHRGM